MATHEQFIGLVRAFNEGDTETAKTMLLQLAASEAAKSHPGLARELKTEAEKIDTPEVHKEGKSEFCEITNARHHLNCLLVPPNIMDRLQRIILEYRHFNTLGSHGLEPSRKILLEGEPGSGKTLTAATLASELHLPLYTIMLDKLLASDPSKAETNFRRLSLEIYRNQAVYLFDTFDALLADRDIHNKVGGYALNSFLQLLEHDISRSIIIVTTNHKNLLGREVLCHFDEVLHYGIPGKEEMREMIERLKFYDEDFFMTGVMWEAACGLSMAEIQSACDIAAKKHVIGGEQISESMMLELFREKHGSAE